MFSITSSNESGLLSVEPTTKSGVELKPPVSTEALGIDGGFLQANSRVAAEEKPWVTLVIQLHLPRGPLIGSR